MDSSLLRLRPYFEQARATGATLVLATVVATRDSTYRKAGAQILIGADGSVEGLLSGGCLEADVAEQAASVFQTGTPKMIHYTHGAGADAPWGLQLGCEGDMSIWLMRLDPAQDWQPFTRLIAHHADRVPPTWGLVLESAVATLPVGTSLWCGTRGEIPAADATTVAGWVEAQMAPRREAALIVERVSPRLRLFVATPPRVHTVLVIGAGPDAQPVVDFGASMGWHMTVVDHRPRFTRPSDWPRVHRVLTARPDEYAAALDLASFDAAIVMSHHMPTDLAALQKLAATAIPYIGQLGPAARRNQLLAKLGVAASQLQRRLHAPIGLPLGGRDPQSIALSIVAQLQAQFHGRNAHP